MDNNQHKISRYPGIRSFEPGEEELFFGRSKEIDELFSLIKVERFAVLFSKSGIGKTSLINAGIIPLLEDEVYYPIKVRLQNKAVSPLEMFKQVVRLRTKQDNLEEVVQKKLNLFAKDAKNPSLWEYLKACSFEQNDEPAIPLLIFDQFEEFFLHQEEQQQELIALLADIIYERVPREVYQEIRKIPRAERTKEHQEWAKPLDWKLMFSIRSDRLSFLDNLSDSIPAILDNRYHLLALNKTQAEDAIIAPAKMRGNEFSTKPFDYSDAALQLILDNLSNEKGEIESFQLQIICGHLEKKVIQLQLKEITPEHIGGAEGIQQILNNYYVSNIATLGSEEEQVLARKLIEEGLIIDGVRVSLAERIIKKQYSISEELLLKLEETRIIKPEQTPLGKAYEVSHDTLVNPILDSYEKRRIQEEHLFEEQERHRLEQEAIEQKRQIEEETKKRRRANFIASIAMVMAVLALIAGGWALNAQINLKTTLDDLEIEKQIALKAKEEAEQALKKFTTEQAAKDQLKYNALKERVRDVFDAKMCADPLLSEMQEIVDKYPENEELNTEIKSLKAMNPKCD